MAPSLSLAFITFFAPAEVGLNLVPHTLLKYSMIKATLEFRSFSLLYLSIFLLIILLLILSILLCKLSLLSSLISGKLSLLTVLTFFFIFYIVTRYIIFIIWFRIFSDNHTTTYKIFKS